jgi:hypothetical protein
VSQLRAHHDERDPQTGQCDRARSATLQPMWLLLHILRSCTIIRISAQLAWSAINAIPFALGALLPYGLSQEEAYDHRTDLIS